MTALQLSVVVPCFGRLRPLGTGRTRRRVPRGPRRPVPARTMRQFAFFVTVGLVNTAVYLAARWAITSGATRAAAPADESDAA
ncbi:hypothetical protein [Streptomyces corynorhini]|uniref:Uncharacterized protein n=1 Tax=Streptomyces corynorhini TaxID=2282652 RepID=A0A370B6C4_9ACTN|nr:hypothetical protein [Streptomyces corynorhini]RDG37387.1 hypothetical protein DVH02_14580 [Streptomyces corynorhini]